MAAANSVTNSVLNEAIAEEKLVELWPENKMKRIKGNSLKIYICCYFEI